MNVKLIGKGRFGFWEERGRRGEYESSSDYKFGFFCFFRFLVYVGERGDDGGFVVFWVGSR